MLLFSLWWKLPQPTTQWIIEHKCGDLCSLQDICLKNMSLQVLMMDVFIDKAVMTFNDNL